jgi:hypothetical protein
MADNKRIDDYDSIADMRRRQADIGLRMQRIALHALEELEHKVASGQSLNMTADEAKVMLDAAMKLIEGSRTTKVN